MRRLIIGMVITLALSLAPGAALAAEAEGAEGAEEGLTVLNKRPFKLGGWGSIFDLVSVGGRLVAVGYDATYEESWAGAWTSWNGRKWKRTHRLPDYTFSHALPLAHEAVLAFRGDQDGCHTRAWRLEAGGAVKDAGLVWPSGRGCPGQPEIVAVAGRPSEGMVAVYGGLGRHGPVVVARPPRGEWQRVRVPGTKNVRAHPVEVVQTVSGFVLIAEHKDGIGAWRSPDGLQWSRPELLPESVIEYARYAPTNTVYDRDRDILLVLATPDRVWRSVGGGPFESAGPLAAPVEADDSALEGAALSDGFLVATGDDDGMRLQSSPDGVTWTRDPDDEGYRAGRAWLVVHGGRVIVMPYGGGSVLSGPATIEAYLPAPETLPDTVPPEPTATADPENPED